MKILSQGIFSARLECDFGHEYMFLVNLPVDASDCTVCKLIERDGYYEHIIREVKNSITYVKGSYFELKRDKK